MLEIELSTSSVLVEIEELKRKIHELGQEKSALLKIAQDSFFLGSETHLNSLNPELNEELGFELSFQTRGNLDLRRTYIEKKNKYISLGKSFASISFLFDLIDEEFTILDLLLFSEILMNDGKFRTTSVFIDHPDGKTLEFGSTEIFSEVSRIFRWYDTQSEIKEISPIVLAILFHYKLLQIHPFTDGNGRISRLVLNLILLRYEVFPVTILPEKREAYYNSLVKADSGDFNELITFYGNLIIEKLKQFLSIAKELEDLDFNKTLLVLTEDGNTDMLNSLLSIHGIDLTKAKIESYDGKENLASAIFFAKKLVVKKAQIKHILIHRDRDNDNSQQVKQTIEKLLKNYELEAITTIFITSNYDIESYFLNERHISELYPAISREKAKDLITQATNDTSSISKTKLRIAYADIGKYGKISDPQQKSEEINDLYDTDPQKYRYGKAVLLRLEELISQEIGVSDKVSLSKYSKHIKINEIAACKI